MRLARAAVYEGFPGRLELREIPVPLPTGAQILVRIEGCTLCGSDLHSHAGRRTVPVPTILGHEIVGRIEAFGPSAPRLDLAGEHLAVGDRVVWAIVASCGQCLTCCRGLPQKCLSGMKYGHEAFRPGLELLGGLADNCLLLPGTAMIRLPEAIPLAVAAPAGCATATVTAALEAAGTIKGRNVCVLGAGMLGLTACAMARALGADEVLCVEPDAHRRSLAKAFGASSSLAPDEMRSGSHVASGSGFDVVVELSGGPDAFEIAWSQARVGATIVLVGQVFPGPPVPISLEQVIRRCITLRGIHNYAPHHLLAAVRFLDEHHQQFAFADLVAAWYPLSRVVEAFERAERRDAIRVGIYPDTSPPEGETLKAQP